MVDIWIYYYILSLYYHSLLILFSLLNMHKWLSIIGIGEDGIAGLSKTAILLVNQAEILVGGERHLAMLPPDDGRKKEKKFPGTLPLVILFTRLYNIEIRTN